MSSKEQPKIAMLDTSFLIRLLKEDDPLHVSAKTYYQYFLENSFVLYVSTVAVAEYCVRGELDQLPFECVRVVPFNLDHADKAGNFARTLYLAKDKGQYAPDQRLIIPNDTKIFAQAASVGALFFVTADTESSKAMDILAKENGFSVVHVDIHVPLSSFSGTLF
jgi:predicted nucleic acid-binding protein